MHRLSPGRVVPAALAVFTLLIGACATGGGGERTGNDPDRITFEELQDVLELSAFEAVRRLRPTWLRARTAGFGAPGRETASVYVDGLRQEEGLRALSVLDTADIREMRFLSAAEATTRFGTNNVGGAILVSTRR